MKIRVTPTNCIHSFLKINKFFLSVFLTVLLNSFLFSTSLFAQSGEAAFKETCIACHTIGKGKLIGPDLANIQERKPVDWFIKFVKSSQTVIKNGDKYADSLFKAYNQIPMPDHANLSDETIKGIYAYITEHSNSSATTATATTTEPLVGNSDRGKLLFVGKIRLTNNGASCNSCHNVDVKGFISGGALAKDLTHAVTRLSEDGVAGIISGLPFPQMKETYNSHPVTPQEIADLTAFLATVNEQDPDVRTSSISNYLLGGGIGGIIILLGLYSFFWIKRKKQPVNDSVFDRQIQSY